MRTIKLRSLLATLLLSCYVAVGGATEPASAPNIEQPLPAISIIIDDLGEQLVAGKQAIALPGQITYAFLPHTGYAARLAELAHQQNKEVMLHMPMQAIGENRLGSGGLTLDMSHNDFLSALKSSLDSVPHISGLNNHMGSLLTQHPGHMTWLMEALSSEHDHLYFVDSRTTDHTIAHQIATEYKVPTISRNVFLDNSRDEVAISRQFERLIKQAEQNGTAVAIGHPYAETLAFLQKALPTLEQRGIELISTSMIIKRRELIEVTIPQAMFAVREVSQQGDENHDHHLPHEPQLSTIQ